MGVGRGDASFMRVAEDNEAPSIIKPLIINYPPRHCRMCYPGRKLKWLELSHQIPVLNKLLASELFTKVNNF